MKTIIADDGAALHVLVRGHGPPVVLLHGWAADHSVWHPIIAELIKNYTVYAWDARGHGFQPQSGHGFQPQSGYGFQPQSGHGGRASAGSEPPTVTRMARDLRAVIRHFGLEKPALVAHSMGVLVVWQMLADFGCDGVGSLCLIDQSPRLMTDADWRLGIYGDWTEARDRAFMADLRLDFAETVLRLIAYGRNEKARLNYEADSRGMQKMRAALRLCIPEPLITCWASLTGADYRMLLPLITVPTLLVYGGASNYYDAETVRYVANRCPGAALHVFEGADHSPHFADRERFLNVLRCFIDDAAGA
ncbi:MAG: alpha/beta hydrolase [Rhodospirillaceae bacterium]